MLLLHFKKTTTRKHEARCLSMTMKDVSVYVGAAVLFWKNRRVMNDCLCVHSQRWWESDSSVDETNKWKTPIVEKYENFYSMCWTHSTISDSVNPVISSGSHMPTCRQAALYPDQSQPIADHPFRMGAVATGSLLDMSDRDRLGPIHQRHRF